MKHIIQVANKISANSSSFLVPSIYRSNMRFLFKKYGNLRNFLRHATFHSHWIFALKPRDFTGKTLYQEKGQNLIKYNFRPYDKDWERFRLLAMTQRISMTRLFVLLLLYLDSINMIGVPTQIPEKIQLFQTIIPNTNNFLIKIKRLLL